MVKTTNSKQQIPNAKQIPAFAGMTKQ